MRQAAITLSRIAVAVGCLAIAGLASAGDERMKWWQSDSMKAELGLTNDQSRELENIFQSLMPRMRVEKDELDRAERQLSKVMAEVQIGEPEVMQTIERVEAARGRASSTRLVMLYRMYKVLTPDQRRKLKIIQERMWGPKPGGEKHPRP
jgi:Spy/CpxP family protein refolding chaperone